MVERPGVLLYFDDFNPALEAMPDEQLGALFRAVMCYAQTGEVLPLDRFGEFVFKIVKPKIDRDGDKLEKKRLHGLYMTYCRTAGEDKLSEKEWLIENYQSTSSELAVNYQSTSSDQQQQQQQQQHQQQQQGQGQGQRQQHAGGEKPPPGQAEAYFRDKIDSDPSTSSMERLRAFEGKMGIDVCNRAIDEAINAGKKSWNYINAILTDKLAKGVRSLEDWDRVEAGYQEGKKHPGNPFLRMAAVQELQALHDRFEAEEEIVSVQDDPPPF